ncbi:hypothetical protein CUJ83_13595 [Methanocella sp. CWC-04]|uniref:Membrane protein involved in the export of O-antigen and teichoic acid n=1 Tax=Methanooceanicella nereidis TaxID=2052831 RepID=A0AAP2RFC2_9EURY|nr:flippase [Methanocella sp. CWC-04]MCD1296032.1 hypothetical protein [Methanocella sp. CWC-04]
MSSVKVISKNIRSLFFAQIVTMTAGIIMTMFIARTLGDANYGKLAFSQTFISLLIIFADLGLNTFATREISRYKELTDTYFKNIMIIKIILSIFTIILIASLINLLNYPADTVTIVYLIGISILLNNFSLFFRSIFRAYDKMEYEAFLNITTSVFKLGLVFIVLHQGYGLIEIGYAFIAAEILNFVLSFIISIKKFTRPKLDIDVSIWKDILIQAIPYGITVFIGLIYLKIDIVILSMIKGYAVVGWYEASCTIIYALVFIPTILNYAIFPVTSRLFITSRDSMKTVTERLLKYSFIISVPILFTLIILSRDIILLIFGEKFESSILILQIMSLYISFRFVNYVLGNTLSSINKEPSRTFCAFIVATVNIALNVMLIPAFSYTGAAVTTVVTEALLFVLYYYYNNRLFYKVPLKSLFFKPIIACFCTMMIVIVFNWLNPILLAALSTACFITALIMTGAFDDYDKKLAKTLFLDNDLIGKVFKNERAGD